MFPLLLFNCYALQAQMQKWILPPYFINNINTPPDAALLPTAAYPGYEGSISDPQVSNAWYDDNGKLVFFVIDHKVFNNKAELEFDLGAFPLVPAGTEIGIIPVPNTCDEYYIISTAITPNGGDCFHYVIITATRIKVLHNFNPNTKLQKISEQTLLNQNVPCKNISPLIAVSPLIANETRFLYIRNYGDVYKFEVNSTSITEDINFYQNINNTITAAFFCNDFYANHPPGVEMELHLNTNLTYTLAIPCINHILLINLDTDGTAILSANKINTVGGEIVGLEFSPDGSQLYFTLNDSSTFGANNNFINVLNVNTLTISPFTLSPDDSGFSLSCIETAADGSLYFAKYNNSNSMSFVQLINPNTPNPANATTVATLTLANSLTNGTPYFLPDQIDGENYNNSVYRAPAACCEHPNPIDTAPTVFDAQNFTVTANATWTQNNNPLDNTNAIRIQNNLVVTSGATLTLQNIQIEFGVNGRIVVQPNAQLILDNATLTNSTVCGMMWQGVRVLGPGIGVNRGLNGNGLPNYGSLVMKEKSLIENALIGVAAMDMPIMDLDYLHTSLLNIPIGNQNTTSFSSLILGNYTNSDLATTTAGGLCYINSSADPLKINTFKNCLQGLNLSWHGNNSANLPGVGNATTQVGYTQFICDNFLLYPFTQIPNNNGVISEVGVALNLYSNIQVAHNQFTNLSYGVRAFEIKGNISKNDLTRLNFAQRTMIGISCVNFTNTPLSKDVTANNNYFNGLTAAAVIGSTDISMQNNYINQNSTDPTSLYGIFLFGCTHNIIQNKINKCTFGIITQESGTPNTIIKRNTLTNIGIVGVTTLGNNFGCEIVCNNFDNYPVAIFSANTNTNNDGILGNQVVCDDPLGVNNDPADNFFGTKSITQLPDLYKTSNMAANYTYYYRPVIGYIPTTNSPIAESCQTNEPVEENCADFVPPINGLVGVVGDSKKNKIVMYTVRQLLQVQHDTTAAAALLTSVYNPAAHRLLLDYLIQKNQLPLAQQVINNLQIISPDDESFKKLSQIKLNLKKTGRTVLQINSPEEQTINHIANKYTRTSFEAQAMLYLARQKEFAIQQPILPTKIAQYLNIQQPGLHFKSDNADVTDKELITVYPNPAQNNITVSLNSNNTKANIVIYSIDGKMVKQQILNSGNTILSTNDLQNGMYYYCIFDDNKILQQSKLIIIK